MNSTSFSNWSQRNYILLLIGHPGLCKPVSDTAQYKRVSEERQIERQIIDWNPLSLDRVNCVKFLFKFKSLIDNYSVLHYRGWVPQVSVFAKEYHSVKFHEKFSS